MATRGEIQNGDEVQDTITGFKGVVVAITSWLNGCERVTIQPKELQTSGKPVDAETFDVEQLKVTKAAPGAVLAPSGGPHDAPTRQATPPRR